MHYQSGVLLTQGKPVLTLPDKYRDVLSEALSMIMPDGTLDILLMKTPSTLERLEIIVSKLYDLIREEATRCGREDIFTTVLLDGRDIDTNRNQAWEVVFAGIQEMELTQVLRTLVPPESPFISGLPVVLIKMSEEFLNYSLFSSPATTGNQTPQVIEEQEEYNSADEEENKYGHNIVALGGTFDHFHDGHKILLTIAGYLSWEKVVVGITGPELLKNKKYAQVMQTYEKRKKNVEDFLNYLFPLLTVQCEMIKDVYGPTATMPEIEALVVSKETSSGGTAINTMRKEKGFHELKIYEIAVIGGEDTTNFSDKLSSTELRRKELELLEREQQATSPNEV